MKRKLLNAVLFASALAVVGTFSSCKDNDEDLRQEMKQDNMTLQQKVDQLNQELAALKATQAECCEYCKGQIEIILRRLGVAEGDIDELTRKILDLSGKVTDPTTLKEEIQKEINESLRDLGFVDENGQVVATYNDIVQDITNITNLITGTNGLQDRINALEQILNGIDLNALQQQVNSNSTEIQNINIKIDTELTRINTQLTTLGNTITALGTQVDDLQNELGNLSTDLSSLKTQIEGQIQTINTSITNINSSLNTLTTSLSETDRKATSALEMAQENKTAIETLNLVTIPLLQARIDGLEDRIEDLESYKDTSEQEIQTLKSGLDSLTDEVGSLQTTVTELETKYNDLDTRIGGIEQTLSTLASKDDLENLAIKVQKNADDIALLQGQVNQLMKVYDYLNSLISGIIMQQAVNPLFGNFSLPIGVQSNMLVNYWGRYTGAKDLVFPSYIQAEGIDGMLTQSDAQMLAGSFDALTIKNGDYLLDDAGLGTVYLTINPANVNFTGGNLQLETSGGNLCGAELRNVRRSYHDITFGGTRAENNGFYEADVVLPANGAAINKTTIEITDGLKSSVKNVLKDPRNKKNLLTLARKVFDQVSEGLPAYCLAAYWNAEDGNGSKKMSVRSNYDLAVATFRPLSYNTYKGQSIDKKFPTRGPLKTVQEYLDEHFNNDRFHFDLGNTTINVKEVEFNFNLDKFELTYTGEIIAHSDGVDVKVRDKEGNIIEGKTDPFSVTVTSTDIKPLIDDLNRQLNAQIDVWNGQLKSHFDEAMNELVDNVNSEVKRALDDLQLNINNQIDDILTDIKSDLAGKLQPFMNKVNKLIEKYNDVADRLNKFLEDPNHYLQVNLIYNAGGGDLASVSNDVNDPTIVTPNGGNAFQVIATSYTMELVAPAYKKFVAVTNVWDKAGNSAKNGNATLKSELQKINKGGNLCKVLPGRAKRIAVDASNMKSGYKYEIVYTAVDYRGYTSTQHFYLKIK